MYAPITAPLILSGFALAVKADLRTFFPQIEHKMSLFNLLFLFPTAIGKRVHFLSV